MKKESFIDAVEGLPKDAKFQMAKMLISVVTENPGKMSTSELASTKSNLDGLFKDIKSELEKQNEMFNLVSKALEKVNEELKAR